MIETTELKCPSCGAFLPYNAQLRKWKCESCGSEFEKEQILGKTQEKSDKDIDAEKAEKLENAAREADPDQPDLNIYRCKSCGGEMVADENTASTFCVYCGNTGILKSRLEGAFRPKYIIPFSKTKQDAIDAYNGLRKGKKFAPSVFGDPKNIEKITGVYIPFWLYNGGSSGSLSGKLHRVKTWRQGDYKYTQTDIYSVLRAGDLAFEKVPADGSKKFDDDLMDSIEPFEFDKIEDFNYSYLSGFLAEKFDVDATEDEERAKLRMKNSLLQSFEKSIDGVLLDRKEEINTEINDVDYALLPVWMLNTKIGDKMYMFAMNGQTGKIVGEIPIDKGKAFGWFCLMSVICIAAICIIELIFDF